MKNLLLLILGVLFLGSCNQSRQNQQSEHQNTSVKTTGPENGTLFIIGGNASGIFYEKFMELVGGPDAPIVVIPTAVSSDTLSDEFLERYKQGYIKRGFNNVTVLHTRNREESNSEEFIAPIEKAAGVWFSGGRQWRHADSYLDTKAHEAFNALLERGGVIAGSSAGATIQGSYLARGDTKANTIMMGDHEEGLNFLTHVAIDQHLFARNRQFDLFEILDNRPELLGIGLDENTGIIVNHDRFRVFGESYVAIYDGTRWSAERDTIYQLPGERKEFYLLKEGDEYDLHKRKVITFDDRDFLSMTDEQFKKYVGLYTREEDTLEIMVKEDTLRIFQYWNVSEYSILPESPIKFFILNSKYSFEFDFNPEGAINKFEARNQDPWIKVQ